MMKKFILFFLLGLCCWEVKVYSQSTCNVNFSTQVTQPSCAGVSDGSIRLSWNCPLGTAYSCYSGTPTVVENCQSCNQTFSGNTDITLAAGQKGCVPAGANLSANNLNINGGKLVICGNAVFLGNVNLGNNDQIIILPGATVTFNNLNYNATNAQITNYGTVICNSNLPMNGFFTNYGTVRVNGDLNTNAGAANFANYGFISVLNNLNNTKTFQNFGTLSVAGTLQNNSVGIFINGCTLTVGSNLINNAGATFTNAGFVQVGQNTTMNSNAGLSLFPGTLWRTNSLTLDNATISNSNASGCSSIQVAGTTIINSNLTVNGRIDICDANGIETNNSPTGFINGASVGCGCTTGARLSGLNGNTTGTLTGLSTGVVTGTISCGSCTQNISIPIQTPNPIQVQPLVRHPSCGGIADGSIQLQVSGGRLPYQVRWANGASGQNLTGLTSGIYTATVRDFSGCSQVVSYTLTSSSSLTASLSLSKTPSCNIATDGRLVAVVTGGTTPYTYSWSVPTSNTATLDGIGGGLAYSLLVLDRNGCAANPSIVVPGSSLTCSTSSSCVGFALNALVNGPTSGSNGNIQTVATGGTGSVSYTWNTGATTSGIFGLTAGTYSVTATDRLGCSINRSYSVTNVASTPSILITTYTNPSLPNASTGGFGFILIPSTNPATGTSSNGGFVGGGFPGGGSSTNTGILSSTGICIKSIQWFNASGVLISSLSRDYLSGLPAGSYTVRVTDCNDIIYIGNGVVSSTNPSFSSNQTSTGISVCSASGWALQLTKTEPLCAGGLGSVTASLTGIGIGTPVYTWSNSITGATLPNVSSGFYTVSAGNATCSLQQSIYLSQPPAVNLNGQVTSAACSDVSGRIELKPSGGRPIFTYSWSNGATTSLITPPVGLYTVTVTNANGCRTTNSYTVTSPSGVCGNCATVQIQTNVAATCTYNGSVTLGFQGGVYRPMQFRWSDGSTLANRTNVAAGIYTITASSTNQVCTTILPLTVAGVGQNLSVTLAANQTPTCAGIRQGFLLASVTGGRAPFTYRWTGFSSITSERLSGIQAGNNYAITITDANGCSATSAIQIPVISTSCPPSVRVCDGFIVNLSKTDPTGPSFANGQVQAFLPAGIASVNWSTGTTGTSVLTNLNQGTYTVTVTGTNGCITTNQTTLINSTFTTCGFQTQVQASIANGSTGSISLLPICPTITQCGTYTWRSVTGNFLQTTTTPSLSGIPNGLYIVSTAGCGGFLGTTTVVVGPPITQPSTCPTVGQTLSLLPTSPTCPNGTGSISVQSTGYGAPIRYSWYPGNQTTAGISNLSSGSYTLYLTDANGCVGNASSLIQIPSSLQSRTMAVVPATCSDSPNGAIEPTISGGNAPYTFRWSNGSTAPFLSNIRAGIYTLTVNDALNCSPLITSVAINFTQSVCGDCFTAIANPIAATCGANGRISIQIQGSTYRPTQFRWSDGSTQADRENLSPGVYTLTLSSINQVCVSILPVTVGGSGQNLSLTLVPIQTPTCSGLSQGFLLASVTGAALPITYRWVGSPEINAERLAGIQAGNNYTVTIEDANRCTQSASIALPVNSTLCTSTTQVCSGFVVNLNKTDPTSPSFANGRVQAILPEGVSNVLWNIGVTGTSSISGLTQGTYGVTVVGINGCVASNSTILTNQTVPTCVLQALAQPSIANGATGSISLVSLCPTLTQCGTYTWRSVTGSFLAITTTPFLTGIPNGNYVISTAGCGGALGTTTVNVGPPIYQPFTCTTTGQTLSLVSSPINCFGATNGSISVSASGYQSPLRYNWLPGNQTTAGLNNLSAGTYTVYVTDALGCIGNASVRLQTPSSIQSRTIAVLPATCSDSPNGAIEPTVSGGNAPYTFRWSNGSTAPSLSNISAGIYTLTVNDALGCTPFITTTAINFTQSICGDCFTLNSSFTQPTCGSNGSIQIIPTAANNRPLNILWSDGAQGLNRSGLLAGTYTVTVSSTNNVCRTTATFVLTPRSPLTISFPSVVAPTCPTSSDGRATVSISGGLAPYTGVWSRLGQWYYGNEIQAIAANNTYLYTVTDANGCVTSTSLNLSAQGSLCVVSCAGVGIRWSTVTQPTLTNANGTLGVSVFGLENATVRWSTGAQGLTLSAIPAGNYTVTAVGLSGCLATQQISLQPISEIITTTLGNTCSFSVTPSPYVSGNTKGNIYTSGITTSCTSFRWTNSSQQIVGTTSALIGVDWGIYSATVTLCSGLTCQATATLAGNGLPNTSCSGKAIQIVPVYPSCLAQGSFQLTASVSGAWVNPAFAWTGGLGTGQTVTVSTPGTYQVVVKDAACQQGNSDVLTIPSVPRPYLSLYATGTNCPLGAPAEVQASVANLTSPYLYTWSTGSTAPSAFVYSAGVVSLTLTDAKGCQLSATTTVSDGSGNCPVTPSLVSSIVPVQCKGKATGEIQLVLTSQSLPIPATFTWADGSTAKDRVGLRAGVYTVTVTAGSFSQTASFTVPEPSVALAVTPVLVSKPSNARAIDGVALASVTGTSASIASYQWSANDGNNLAGIQATVSGISYGGSYAVSIIDANKCSATGSITIPTSTIIGEPDPCSSIAVNLTQSQNPTTSTASDGKLGIQILPVWGTQTITWNTGGNTPSISGLASGTYTVTVQSAILGCTIIQSYILTTATVPSNGITSCPGLTSISSPALGTAANGGVIVLGIPLASSTGQIYTWKNASQQVVGTSVNLTQVPLGSYTFTWTQPSGTSCTLNATVPFIEVPDPCLANRSLSSTVTPVTCFGGTNGSIQTTLIGNWTNPTYQWQGVSSSSASVSNLAAGNYVVTVRDQQCPSVFTSVRVESPADLNVDVSVVNASCENKKDGKITALVQNGISPLTYVWNGTSSSLNNLITGAGVYTLQVRDQNLCQSSVIPVTVGFLPPPCRPEAGDCFELSVLKNDISCAGETNGSISILPIFNPVGFLTYRWSHDPSLQGPSATQLSAGTYTITVSGGSVVCTTVVGVTIANPQPLAVSVTQVNPISCKTASSGSLLAQGTGGVGSYTYVWNDGNNSQQRNGLGEGIYEVLVRDGNRCVASSTYSFQAASQANCPATPCDYFAFEVQTIPTTQGQSTGSALVTNLTGSQSTPTYGWSNGAANAPAVSGLAAGNYTVTVSNTQGCSITHTFTISAIPGSGSSTSPGICTTTSYSIPATGSASNGSVGVIIKCPEKLPICVNPPCCNPNLIVGLQWYNASRQPIAGQTGTVLTGQPAGTYYLVTTNDCGGTSETSYVISSIPTDPDPNCGQNKSITLSLVQGASCTDLKDAIVSVVSQNVTSIAYSQSITSLSGNRITNINPGTLLTAWASECPSVQASVYIDNPEAIRGKVVVTQPTCSNNNLTGLRAEYTPTDNLTYLWDPGMATSVSIAPAPGTYALTVAGTNNCSVTSSNWTINPNNVSCTSPCNFAISAIGKPVTCKDNNDGYIAYGINTEAAGTAPYNVQGNITNLSPGTGYAITVTDANGCSSTIRNLTVDNSTRLCIPPCTIASDLKVTTLVCPQEPNPNDRTSRVELTIFGPEPWKVDWLQQPQYQDQRIIEKVPAGYYHAVIYKPGFPDCKQYQTARVTEPEIPQILYTSLMLCPIKAVILTASYALENNNNWIWSLGNQTVGSGRFFVATAAGTYSLRNRIEACTKSIMQPSVTVYDGGENCPNPQKALCEPTVLEPIPLADSCARNAIIASRFLALNQFNTYIEEEKANFRTRYIEQCLNAQEDLIMNFQDREHHYTLYYYDQAGNLVRTVPPQGVKPITDAAKLAQVIEDRKNDQKTVFTEHDYLSTYTYNSLNQLVAQNVPDHDPMQIDAVKVTPINSSFVPSGQAYAANGTGFVVGTEGTEGRIYFTANGGSSYQLLTKIGVNNLLDVWMVDASTAYACGEKGIFVKSTDGGQTWIILPTGTSDNLTQVLFTSATNGTIYNSVGKAWQTTDGGTTWTPVTGATSLEATLNGKILADLQQDGSSLLAVANASNQGYAFTSADGGQTWTAVTGYRVQNLSSVSLASNGSGYAINAAGIVLKTTDAGTSWKPLVSNLSNASRIFTTSNGTSAVTLANQSLYRTYDGQAWDNAYSSALSNVVAVDIQGGIGAAVNTSGDVYISYNGGMSWTKVTTIGLTGSAAKVFVDPNTAISIYSGSSLYVADWGNFGNYTIYNLGFSSATAIHVGTTLSNGDRNIVVADGKLKTGTINNMGATLTSSTTDATYLLFTNATSGFSVHSSGSVAAIDNTTITPKAGVGNSVADVRLFGTKLIATGGTNSQNLYVLSDPANASAWTETGGTITPPTWSGASVGTAPAPVVVSPSRLVATQSGTDWVLAPLPQAAQAVAVTNGGAMAVGNSISQYQTNTWSSLSGGDSQLSDVVPSSNGYTAVSAGGSIYTIAADGSSVSSSYTGSTPLTAVASQGNTRIAVGNSGTILVDNGSGFAAANRVETKTLTATQLVDGNTGFAVGAQGTAIKTGDGGRTWTSLNANTSQNLTALAFANTQLGLLGGANGILRTTDGGNTFAAVSGVPGPVVDLAFPSATLALALTPAALYTSNNGGTSWTLAYSAPVGKTFTRLYMVDASFGYAVGTGSLALKIAFTAFNSNAYTYTVATVCAACTTGLPLAKDLTDVHFVDYLTGYLIGRSGFLAKTADGGQTWSTNASPNASGSLTLGTTNDLTSLTFITPTQGFVTDDAGNVTTLTDERDQYSTKFWYDELGRLSISQNSKQFAQNPKAYSYTRYDRFGRITEVGEVATSANISTYATSGFPSQVAMSNVTAFIATGTAAQITKTYYDEAAFNVGGLVQENLRPRVASVTYQDASGATYDRATHYSYDIHGNVESLVQEIKLPGSASARTYRMDYDYDLISGKVNSVTYQPGLQDQFIHRYVYDADNRITEVQTSRDGVLWDSDARYTYYKHGPLARMELGNASVQGVDFAYTLQGWIKAVNSNELSPDRDMGGDGSLLSRVARDAYGYSLGYHGGDYAPIGGTQAQGVVASETALASASQAPNLWNGNIRSMATTLADPQTYTPQPQLATYSYDQLNRIKSMQVYQSLSQNAWQPLGTQAYASGFTYDANGNILTKTQKDKDGNWRDQLDYKYQTVANGNKRNTNRLGYVLDATTTPTDATDIETQAAGNYAYDGIGNLIQDNAEDIANIEWTVYGKVKKVTRTAGSTHPDLEFAYDAGGHRVAKIVKPAATKTDPNTYTTTVYVLDASGNTMATYQLQGSQYQLEDQYFYGSSRIGVASRNETMSGTVGDVFVVGNKQFELTNHLGNVLAVVSDRRVYVTTGTQTDPIFIGTVPSSISYGIGYAQPDILSTTDYYPFGESMAGRSYQGGGYRYGFNGKENDPEMDDWQDYGMRAYLKKIGRFPTVDKLSPKYPMLSPFQFSGNTPIMTVDVDGLESAFAIVQQNDDGTQVQVESQYDIKGKIEEQQFQDRFPEAPKDGYVTVMVDKNGKYISSTSCAEVIVTPTEAENTGTVVKESNLSLGERADRWINSIKGDNGPFGTASIGAEYDYEVKKGVKVKVTGRVYSTNENTAGIDNSITVQAEGSVKMDPKTGILKVTNPKDFKVPSGEQEGFVFMQFSRKKFDKQGSFYSEYGVELTTTVKLSYFKVVLDSYKGDIKIGATTNPGFEIKEALKVFYKAGRATSESKLGN